MGLSRLAMRICAARAIKGATLAEDRVFDSVIDPIDQKMSQTSKPIVMVSTDDVTRGITGRDMTGGEGSCDLVIEVAIASRADLPGKDGEGAAVVVEMPPTDAAFEAMIDVLEFQTVASLLEGRGVWAELWKRVVARVLNRQSRRGVSTENGVRFAARQLILSCDLLTDPIRGEPVEAGTFWADFLAAVAADPEMAPLADWLRLEIEGDTERPAWVRAADALGVTDDTMAALGIVPDLDENGEPIILDTVTFDDGEGGDFTVPPEE